jgi:cellulose synthase/poly-beta-1,6-N-acetylglucosamine synthase-like glycosyltransferase/peptidoglycan/xylan/chitin deacetylase (PgdA/CDA1 family)/spore germination protein YaaH
MADNKPVFHDERRQRWSVTRRTLEISGAALALLLVVLGVGVFGHLQLPETLLPAQKPTIHPIKAKAKPVKATAARTGRKRRVAGLGKIPENYDPLQAGFYVSWDPTSFASLQQNYRHLDLLIPEKLHAISEDGRLIEEPDPKLDGFLRRPGVELPVMPLVNNTDGVNFHPEKLVKALQNPRARQRLISGLLGFASGRRAAGIVVDFELLPESSFPVFRQFLAEFADVMHRANLKVMVALPALDFGMDYRLIASHVDAIILMNYDEHWTTAPAGPVASQEWYTKNLDLAFKEVPPQKLMVAVGSYAYDWPAPTKKERKPTAQPLSFQDAVVRAQESESEIELDSDHLNAHFTYSDDDNRNHDVWMVDGVAAFNQIRAAEVRGARGIALWRLGSEDPSLWSVFEATASTEEVRARLAVIAPGYDLVLEGEGDIWRVLSTPAPGARTFQYDPSVDLITGETYTKFPETYRIQQLGAVPGKVAITFDDGPDPVFTPRILDVLKEKNAPATFFVIGEHAKDNPRILKRMYAEGHEIGNHTFSHPHFDATDFSETFIRTQLNLTELVLESTLFVKSILFRPPYGIDHQPDSADEVALLPIPQKFGYLLVGARIDPHDWEVDSAGDPRATSKIVNNVLASSRKGHIILLHDGGGDRSATVAALPQIIDGLRAQGLQVVSVSELIGQSRAEVMPQLVGNEKLLARADSLLFDLSNVAGFSMTVLYLAGIVLVSGRAMIVGLLALAEKLRRRVPEHPDFQPLVSVVIPAHNEEAAIEATVRSVLASGYAPLEVVVVNDGSADATKEILERCFSSDARVRLHHQVNRGKPAALNQALAMATGEIIVTIDADTRVHPAAIARLVRHFADPTIGAVAGNVKVGNRTAWITRWQALEYITSQNMEKRAFDLLNCITVVPGALGAWRAEAIRGAGGFVADTLAEDTDLTFSIRRRGWRISYEADAKSYTDAPETPGALVRQRFRWTYGTLQAVWKHRDTLGRPRFGTLGFIALPNVFLFQILLPLVSPVIDLMFLLTLGMWGLAQLQLTRFGTIWTQEDVQRSLFFFALFMLIDFVTCVLAFALEWDEDWSLLFPLILQRFYYRQLMYVVLFRAVVQAWKGGAVGWRGVQPQPRPDLPAAARGD